MSPHEPHRPQDNAWGCDQFVAGESHGPCGICPGCMRRAHTGELSVSTTPDASLRALVEQWRTKGAQIDAFHATMGVGYKACADELESLLSARAGAEPKPRRKAKPPCEYSDCADHYGDPEAWCVKCRAGAEPPPAQGGGD